MFAMDALNKSAQGRFLKAKRQGGFIVAYIMMGIALIAISMSALAFMHNDSAGKLLIYNNSVAIQKQIASIQGMVTNCALLYPTGNNGSGYHNAYPGGASVDVLQLTCPGAPFSNKNLWTGRNGTVPPLAPRGMGGWVYTNDASGIRLTISAGSDVDLNRSLTSAMAHYTPSQVSISGGTLTYWLLQE